MSLTNFTSTNPKNENTPEQEKIFDICKKLSRLKSCCEIMSKQSPETESYYSDKADLQLFDNEIFNYDFNTPAELRNTLENMWEHQRCEHMKEFAVVATIATFHNKKEHSEETKVNIPAFIYNF